MLVLITCTHNRNTFTYIILLNTLESMCMHVNKSNLMPCLQVVVVLMLGCTGASVGSIFQIFMAPASTLTIQIDTPSTLGLVQKMTPSKLV